MATPNQQLLPEVFRTADAKRASRALERGELRRLARGLYTRNLEEPAESLLRRRWYEAAGAYFPGSVVVDRSATTAGPDADGTVYLDTGPDRRNPRSVQLPGLRLRPRQGPGPLEGDVPFAQVFVSGPARTVLENLRPSRARTGLPRTLRPEELEQRLDRLAQVRGEQALNELRDEARRLAPALGAERELEQLDRVIGALLGTREAPLRTRSARARREGLAYDTDRLALFEVLRAELASAPLPARSAPADPERLLAFFEAYFSNWIEGTEFELGEAQEIIFEGRVPAQRPADAHDIQGTFEAILDPRLGSTPPRDADELESFLRDAHARIMQGRPELGPGEFKTVGNRAGATTFVAPALVRGTLHEGFALRDTLPPGLARAIYVMFLVAEVHPFTDGNGRVARIVMNAELSAIAECRVMVPMSYRDEYLSALRALTHNSAPTPLVRMLDRAQRWVAAMTWSPRERVLALMEQTNALVRPEETRERNLHLLDPPRP